MLHSHHCTSFLALRKKFFLATSPSPQTDTDWTLAELKCARARFNINKICDESGLAVELFQHVRIVSFPQWHYAMWKNPRQNGKNIVDDASQNDPRKTCDGFPPHCQHTALLQGDCLHDPRTSGAVIGKYLTINTTRFSLRPTNGRTHGRLIM